MKSSTYYYPNTLELEILRLERHRRICLMFSLTFVHFQVGFFSGRKRESIFKSPDDPFGKVGVTGSGKGLTEFQKREKHLHLKGGTAEADD